MLSSASVFVTGLPKVHYLGLVKSGSIDYSGTNNDTAQYTQRPALYLIKRNKPFLSVHSNKCYGAVHDIEDIFFRG